MWGPNHWDPMKSKTIPRRTAAPEIGPILDELRRIVRTLRVTMHAPELGGLSTAQLFVLQQLDAAPGAALRDLAARTHTDPSSVSAVVAKLVAARLVKRVASTDDRRRLALSLTRAGEAALRRAPAPPQETLIAALERLPGVARRSLLRGLERLTQDRGISEGPAGLFFEETHAKPTRHRG